MVAHLPDALHQAHGLAEDLVGLRQLRAESLEVDRRRVQTPDTLVRTLRHLQEVALHHCACAVSPVSLTVHDIKVCRETKVYL